MTSGSPNKTFSNPVLKGFNPDPSLILVDGVYYLATSTFEWFPGVQIHCSRDLVNWELAARPLNEKRLLDIEGVPDSCGVWAPCLSFHNDTFFLAYTVVRRFDGNFKDTHNFVTTATAITGVWSDPVFINSSGFDPSIFHDGDQKWWLNMVWDHRPDQTPFYGISLQALDERLTLVGKPKLISKGSDIGLTEGPHLYRIGNYIYLIVAEGGTGYGHTISVARSLSVEGPYEFDPKGPLMTARDTPEWPLQRSGHGALVHLAGDDYLISFLCSRRTGDQQHSTMGRETALANVVMTADGWLRQSNSRVLPPLDYSTSVSVLDTTPARRQFYDSFEGDHLSLEYQWLRQSERNSWSSLFERKGHLRLVGQESPGSLFKQSLIATRLTDWHCTVETCLAFNPTHFQAMAGLMIYYNSQKFHYLHVSYDPELGKVLNLMSCLADEQLHNHYPLGDMKIPLKDGPTHLRFTIAADRALAYYKESEEAEWTAIPADIDMTCLTDQAGMASGEQFTGSFVGMAAHDVSGRRATADFSFFSYRE